MYLIDEFIIFSNHYLFLVFTVVCPPTNLTGVTNCNNNDITVQWNPSPRSGVNYLLYSQESGGASASYSTNQTSYVITALQCGMVYTFTAAARDSFCTSVLSKPIKTETSKYADILWLLAYGTMLYPGYSTCYVLLKHSFISYDLLNVFLDSSMSTDQPHCLCRVWYQLGNAELAAKCQRYLLHSYSD